MKSLFVVTHTKRLSTVVGLCEGLVVWAVKPATVFISSKPVMNRWVNEGTGWGGHTKAEQLQVVTEHGLPEVVAMDFQWG